MFSLFALDIAAWPQGEETQSSVLFVDPFLIKLLIVIAAASIMVGLIVSLGRYQKRLSQNRASNVERYKSNELLFEKGISRTRIITCFSLALIVSIALLGVIKMAVAIIISFFLFGFICYWLYVEVYITPTKMIINREKKTVVLSSWIGQRLVKPEEIKEYSNLIFEQIRDKRGRVSRNLFIDEIDSSRLIWKDFTQNEMVQITEWLKELEEERSLEK